jgi:lysophospholipase L1-like esterase
MKSQYKIYMLLIHLLLAIVIWQSDFLRPIKPNAIPPSPRTRHEITSHYLRMLMYHSRSVKIVPNNAVIVIGDSLVQGLCAAAISSNSVNYGIGSDTTVGVIQRLPIYMPALKQAKCIVMAIGTNDFYFRNVEETKKNYQKILRALPKDRPTVISSVLPVDETDKKNLEGRNLLITQLNVELKNMASKENNIWFLDNSDHFDTDGDGLLDRKFHVGDGVHLNPTGNAVWVDSLKQVISESRDAMQNR